MPALSGPGTGERVTYSKPSWLPTCLSSPKSRLLLAHLPTPLHRWTGLPYVDAAKTEVLIKRDDFTGCELSGNKVRKLEFLLADAQERGCDSVITVGGLQSNHCRATAAAARRVGLTPHIILRSVDPVADGSSLVGNLLIDRLVGAQMHLVSESEYAVKGGWELVCELKEELESKGSVPYAFPSGGSNELGLWGYLQAVDELCSQLADVHVDRIYFACGSGGTAAGLALGVLYSGLSAKGTELVGLGVDDSPQFFYDKIDGLIRAVHTEITDLKATELLRIEDCVGDGYAQSTDAELQSIAEIAQSTGVCLDPVYTGKAVLGMTRDLRAWPVSRALFIHTGGLLGLYAQAERLAAML
eukprot:TRINITY_DN69230_c0_g1_i1.p1 TRINITY_DN69230_c0_g1~~TRINITY_DN69230_c0_g1_i1.p1  ORF type:complete len:390 (+),score=39.82 TRINITY_DN69230_c0_g1_i1:101-1171(+)